MPDIRADELITRQNKRMFVQYGGSRPGNKIYYAGQGTQYLQISGASAPETGGVTPIWVPDPRKARAYKLAGRVVAPADLAKAELAMREKHAAIPKQLTRIGCMLNVYELTGVCGDLSDFVSGWSDYVLVYSAGLITDKDLGQRSAFDGDEPIEDRMSLVLADIYPVGQISFGEQAATEVDREVTDAVYYPGSTCGDCGPANDGTLRIYAITRSSGAGSPGLPGELLYSLDGGLTWTQTSITGLGASEDPVHIDIAGKYLIVIGSGAYYYSEINSATGVPGAWTKVSTGFVASKNPNDMFVLGPREVYMCGDGGYIYLVEDVTAGASVLNAGVATTSNLYRIHGNSDVIVAVGASGTIIKSINRGITWSTTITSPVTLNSIRSVWVMDKNRFWVGIDLIGRLYYTLNGGETWTEKTFSGNGSGTVWDINFPTDEVGYFSHATTTPTARIFATWNGGVDWTNTSPRLNNWPTFDKATSIVTPKDVDAATNANNVVVAGLAGNGTDGIVLVGYAGKL